MKKLKMLSGKIKIVMSSDSSGLYLILSSKKSETSDFFKKIHQVSEKRQKIVNLSKHSTRRCDLYTLFVTGSMTARY